MLQLVIAEAIPHSECLEVLRLTFWQKVRLAHGLSSELFVGSIPTRCKRSPEANPRAILLLQTGAQIPPLACSGTQFGVLRPATATSKVVGCPTDLPFERYWLSC